MWTGRIDNANKERFHQNVTEDLSDLSRDSVTFIGFASDEGVKRNLGRPGAKEGPQAIRQALSNLPCHRKDLKLYDAGTIQCENSDLEKAQSELASQVTSIIKANSTPIVLGGGHEVAWGHFQGIADAIPLDQFAIINFDAHLDMRPYSEKGSSGTPFLQIANEMKARKKPFSYSCIGLQPSGNTENLLNTAKTHHVQSITAEEIHLNGLDSSFQLLKEVITNHQNIYLTFCMDVFSSAYAPGVSAPQPLGLTPWQVIPLLRFLAKSGKVISLDIAELSPCLDANTITAKLAAELLSDLIHQMKR